MKQQVPINPALLRWARCAAGLSLKDAAARAKITALRRPKNQTSVTPEDRLASWEDGRTSPSISQLKALANAYPSRKPGVCGTQTTYIPAAPRVVRHRQRRAD